MSNKTASGLVEYCRAQIGKPYWFGTFGNTATAELYASRRRMYPSYYTASDFSRQFGQRVHDCSGLIKGYLWSETPTSQPRYDAAEDWNVAAMYNRCVERGTLKSIPDTPGVLVFMANMEHVGVYIGKGEVIEARGHAYGVVKTRLSSRGWALWGKPRFIDYGDDAAQNVKPVKPEAPAQNTTTSTTEEKTIMVQAKQLSSGSKGSAVRKLQILLNGLNYNSGAVDGDFGPKTLSAVRTFQAANDLTTDGVVGPATWGALIG